MKDSPYAWTERKEPIAWITPGIDVVRVRDGYSSLALTPQQALDLYNWLNEHAEEIEAMIPAWAEDHPTVPPVIICGEDEAE